ncbi:MAG: hypothetical protein AAGD92_16000 [Pseudomonadota bacterium]
MTQKNPLKPEHTTVFYRDRRFRVTAADIATPNSYFPLAATTGKIRRDILYASVVFSGLIGVSLWAYADLWRFHEMIILAGIMILSMAAGLNLSLFEINARGFSSRVYVARTSTIRQVLAAIMRARAAAWEADHAGGCGEAAQFDNTSHTE